MCGIVGAVAERNVVEILLEGLKRLEYRGYDSAGVAGDFFCGRRDWSAGWRCGYSLRIEGRGETGKEQCFGRE